jgi:hypothetical protein
MIEEDKENGRKKGRKPRDQDQGRFADQCLPPQPLSDTLLPVLRRREDRWGHQPGRLRCLYSWSTFPSPFFPLLSLCRLVSCPLLNCSSSLYSQNHEFDANDTALATFLSNLTFPTVATNVRSTYQPLSEQLMPYVLFPQHELAIVGLTTTDVPNISQPGNGTTFEPLVESVQPVVDGLLDGSIGGGNGTVKRVVALTHIGGLSSFPRSKLWQVQRGERVRETRADLP